MLRILGHPSRACDGLTRRELLTAGALSLLAPALARSNRPSSAGTAKAVILIDLFGGPSHIDTFDPKPDAPAEVRGEFATVATRHAGVRFTEHVPRLARMADRFCLIRTVSHRYNSHNPYGVMTGFDGGQDQTNYFARPTDHPSIASVAQYLGGLRERRDLPPYVVLPAFPGYSQGLRRAGPYGGYLGSAYDPLFSACDPKFSGTLADSGDFYDADRTPMGDPRLPDLSGDLTLDALDRRRGLLSQLDDRARRLAKSAEGSRLTRQQAKAFDLLLSQRAREAFDVSREPPALRQRYGRDLFGSSTLMARRLVEAGVSYVAIHTEAKPNGHWDTHSNNFNMLKRLLLPFLDRALSALIEDLDARGMLASTLVVVTGDMGRTPRVNKQAGRDHWPQCGFCILAGGGTRPGVVGTSDRQAAYPVEHPVSSGDLAATMYHLMGVDPEATVPDQTGRPVHISHGGKVVRQALA
ncbi:MAG: DUF1501 domain-containing protein [Gemmataceae bacterium]